MKVFKSSRRLAAAAVIGGLALVSVAPGTVNADPVSSNAPTVVLAQQQTPTPGAAANRVEGTVSNVSGSGFTLTTRYGNQTVAVTTTPQTRYRVTTDVALSSLQTGTPVAVGGEVDDTAGTITARQIIVLQKLPNGLGNGQAAGQRRGVLGTVATTSPSLTVTGLDGKTYTVTTTARTMVHQTQPGTVSSVTNGSFVRVMAEPGASTTTGTSTSVTARGVEVIPVPTLGGGQGFGHRRRNNQGAAPGAASSTEPAI